MADSWCLSLLFGQAEGHFLLNGAPWDYHVQMFPGGSADELMHLDQSGSCEDVMADLLPADCRAFRARMFFGRSVVVPRMFYGRSMGWSVHPYVRLALTQETG
ncbi:hypothetical protein F5884DRAFT_746869 [Xylogone sp. PMI_703]|nr:hypothetical protein F5884DRAFT_746869 [Xylogone sp. PMI_703]